MARRCGRRRSSTRPPRRRCRVCDRMRPAGIGLVAASILLDLPSALARLFLTAVIAGLAGLLDWRGDLIVLLVAFGPYLRSVGALVVPLPAGPFLRQAAGARKPSERERAALQHAFSLLPDGVAPGSVLVVDGPDENAWVLGCTLFVERGLFDSPHLAAVMAHEAGHLAAGDGRVALAASWLPVRSAAWVAARLMGSRHRSLPPAGTALPQPQAAGPGAGIRPAPRFRTLRRPGSAGDNPRGLDAPRHPARRDPRPQRHPADRQHPRQPQQEPLARGRDHPLRPRAGGRDLLPGARPEEDPGAARARWGARCGVRCGARRHGGSPGPQTGQRPAHRR